MLWRAELDASTLEVGAEASVADDLAAFDLRRVAQWATLAVEADGREHLSLADGPRRVRLDCLSGTLLEGPVVLQFRLEGFGGLGPKLLTLRRLLALWSTGSFAASLFPADKRTSRIVMALRVHDALTSGASLREIGAVLYGEDHEWPGAGESTKSRVRRLITLARRYSGPGYRLLLNDDELI